MRNVAQTLVVTALVATLAGCGGGAQESQASDASSVTVAISSDEGTLTPFTNQTGYPGNNLVKLVFDTIAAVEGDEVVPLLAEEIETEDNQTFTIPLPVAATRPAGDASTAGSPPFAEVQPLALGLVQRLPVDL